jgi:O-antigen/teichoic acid export membrane protein
MTSFVLKIIAMVTMVIDHSGDIFFPILGNNTLYFNAIGRIAFPLFCFMLVEGYKHTSNLKKYMLRLFIGALISQIPFQILVQTINGILHGLGKVKTTTISLLIGTIVKFICNIIFLQNPVLLEKGAVLSSICCYSVILLIVVIQLVKTCKTNKF